MRTFRVGVWGMVGLCAACFDSDEKASQAQGTGSTGSGSTASASPTTVVGEDGSTSVATGGTTVAPDVTCRDAVACLGGCALDLVLNPTPEPELDCFLICEEQLTVPEAVDLLRLVNCASDRCAQLGLCTDDTGTTGAATSTTGGTGGGDDGTPVFDPCLQCVFETIADPAPPGCIEFAQACD